MTLPNACVGARRSSFVYSLATFAAISLLGGCAPTIPLPAPAPGPTPVDTILPEAARSAASSLEILAGVEQARRPPASIKNDLVPFELKKEVSLRWSGPVAPALIAVAGDVGYVFSTIGREPPSPIIVTVKAENEPAFKVLQDIGLQAGSRASVAVDIQNRRVELRYEQN
jgi:defect-in-organelle-trafficking protein DotD